MPLVDNHRGHVDLDVAFPSRLARPVGQYRLHMLPRVAAAGKDPLAVGDKRRHAFGRRALNLPQLLAGRRIEARNEVAALHEKLIVSGVQKVQPGAPAKATPWKPAAPAGQQPAAAAAPQK